MKKTTLALKVEELEPSLKVMRMMVLRDPEEIYKFLRNYAAKVLYSEFIEAMTRGKEGYSEGVSVQSTILYITRLYAWFMTV